MPTDGDHRFKHALFDDVSSGGITVRELHLLDFINQITDKENWHNKILDATIVAKWRSEALSDRELFTPRMFDFAMQELKYKASKFEKTGMVSVLDCDCTIVKSDTAISPDLRKALRDAVRPLEMVSPSEQDWHPGSNGQVLDLVHPSLFPVVSGHTKALSTGQVSLHNCLDLICKGTKHVVLNTELTYSDSYQWLPSQIDIQEDKSVKITTYINNLHPTAHSDLYEVLEQILARTLPLWDECLSVYPNRKRIVVARTDSSDWIYPERPRWYSRAADEQQLDLSDPDTDDEEDAKYEWEQDNGEPQHRDIARDFVPYDIPQGKTLDSPQGGSQDPKDMPPELVNLAQEYRSSGLQVIFKLATIHLTPENATYNGGTWHIEGTRSERICASAIYYYDQENISDSHLAFRQILDVEAITMIPEQNEHAAVELMFGTENETPAVQELGQILTRENRLLVFPNTLKHRVGSFRLVDRDRPGHRKILAMFLVDPSQKIPSTAEVPPQQREWWADTIRRMAPFSQLPYEIFDHIMHLVDGDPMSMPRAKEIRLDLMAKRSAAVDQSNQDDMNEARLFERCEL